MTTKSINDPTVDEAVENATSAACRILDEVFPGTDNGGITSNFQGLLADHIRAMLLGDTHSAHRYVPLPKLAHQDEKAVARY